MVYIHWIADTIWEFWQYIKPQGNVYLAGVKHPTKDGYLFITMIPEWVDVPDGYVRLTNAMPLLDAAQRWNHFKLIELVVPEKSIEIGT